MKTTGPQVYIQVNCKLFGLSSVILPAAAENWLCFLSYYISMSDPPFYDKVFVPHQNSAHVWHSERSVEGALHIVQNAEYFTENRRAFLQDMHCFLTDESIKQGQHSLPRGLEITHIRTTPSHSSFTTHLGHKRATKKGSQMFQLWCNQVGVVLYGQKICLTVFTSYTDQQHYTKIEIIDNYSFPVVLCRV